MYRLLRLYVQATQNYVQATQNYVQATQTMYRLLMQNYRLLKSTDFLGVKVTGKKRKKIYK
jgi:hypothetical protein